MSNPLVGLFILVDLVLICYSLDRCYDGKYTVQVHEPPSITARRIAGIELVCLLGPQNLSHQDFPDSQRRRLRHRDEVLQHLLPALQWEEQVHHLRSQRDEVLHRLLIREWEPHLLPALQWVEDLSPEDQCVQQGEKVIAVTLLRRAGYNNVYFLGR